MEQNPQPIQPATTLDPVPARSAQELDALYKKYRAEMDANPLLQQLITNRRNAAGLTLKTA